ncbi:hypothetical protein PF011_g19268 [Phytophthora fragariae]|uniref:PEP-utilising enzyme C-terminal domain-containing protein n=1 Tax=Phytophthora fragariae TaxID=53985 RepID=A0A6A3J9J6_9STRA|nr:hypothetical protein PF011_g19268 [Phytophthora fragariae]
MSVDLVQFVKLLMKWQMHQCMEQIGFEGIPGLCVAIHTLESPLYEFLADKGIALDELCETLSKEMKVSKVLVQSRMSSLKEANPIMGLRGSHLGITEMQTKAIAEAVMKLAGEGISVHPHIVILLLGKLFDYKVPHGALQPGTLAEVAEFYSFGTNDLTQMTFGSSRDDGKANFLSYYVKHSVLERKCLRRSASAEPNHAGDAGSDSCSDDRARNVVRLTVVRGRAMRPMTKVCLYGEHAATPDEDAG